MALLRYMKPSRGLPDPKSLLSASVPLQVIAEANKEVQKVMQATKRGPYLKLSPSLQCEIAKYAGHHRATVAAQHYSRKLEKRASESTVKSIKEGIRRRATEEGTDR